MGLFDNLKNVLGGKKDSSIVTTTKAPSLILKENGVDPSGLKFSFGTDGTVTVTGEIKQESDRARIKELLIGIPGIKQVKQDLKLAKAAEKPVQSEAVVEDAPASPAMDETPIAAEAPSEESGAAAGTYTVQPGDTLWKISKQFYGEGSQYLKIFEANKGLLKDPDHIFPGQELVIPEK